MTVANPTGAADKRWRAVALLLLLTNPAKADLDHYADVMRGRALATAGDCVACHTAPGGTPFAGGLGLQTPFGTIMTANLTPDDATGLGKWSADDFARALHDGVGRDGSHLYPAFPYPYYTKVIRADADAIYAYLRTLPPTANLVDRSTLPFPFSIRASLAAWNALFLARGQFSPDPKRSEAFNRGAYLVEGLGHCGACHTPLNALGANKGSQFLEANQIDQWTAPNITNDLRIGVGTWSPDDIVEYLHTGRNSMSIASGPMAEVISYSTSQMAETDLQAMAVYLKERGAAGSAAPNPVSADDPRMRAGEAIFLDSCSACHTRTGVGVDHLFPHLAGNPLVQQDEPTTLIRVVLTGVRGAVTNAAPTGPAMPSLGYRLNDEQVAAVLTYVRNAWGNAASAVAASGVRRMRDATR